jgi:heterodisulfide reductase subunit C
LTIKEEVIRDITFNFRDEVINAGSKIFQKEDLERFKLCIQCGNCAGGCPSGRRTSWRIRKIFEETSLGLKEKVFSDESLWNCTTCYTCQERCPRGIHTTDIVRVIRNLAVKSGYMRSRHKKVCEIFLMQGHAVPINDEIKEIRKKLGLNEVPPTVLSYPEGFKEVLKLLEKTGFKMIVEEAKNE